MRRGPQTYRTLPPAPAPNDAPAVDDRMRALRVEVLAAQMERLGLHEGCGRVAGPMGSKTQRPIRSDRREQPWAGFREAAEALGVSTQTVWARLKDGKPCNGHRLSYAD